MIAALAVAFAGVVLIFVDAVLFDADDDYYWEGEPPQPTKRGRS
jgi:hypothetical protein